MVAFHDMQELLMTCALIAAFSIYGFFVPEDVKEPDNTPLRRLADGGALHTEQAAAGVTLIANPVVQINVPAHNVFAP